MTCKDWVDIRNHVNNEADPTFTAAVAQAVADLLLTLTVRITDEIRQNENNRNNGNRRNARRVNTEGSGNDGNAQPTDIHVWLERFQKQKPETFSSASTLVEAENWIAHIEKIFEVLGCDDQFKARELMIEGIVTDMETEADMATKTWMEIIRGVVIYREVTDMEMAVTNGVLVLRGCGGTRISRFRANNMVV
nr:hypothetical protein [Tanacetum cinerariifolium]